VWVAERVQALASAAAAIERAPASVDMAMSFFMVAISLMDGAAVAAAVREH
jgi:hypothetical protein